MALCPKCGQPIQSVETVCPHCGAVIAKVLAARAARASHQAQSVSIRSRRRLIVGAIATCVAIVSLSIAAYHASKGMPRFNDGSYVVTYAVEGTAPTASITYVNAQSGIEMIDTAIPWNHTMTVRDGQILSIQAQQKSEWGTITVRIRSSGTELRKSESSGAYAVAQAGGACCR